MTPAGEQVGIVGRNARRPHLTRIQEPRMVNRRSVLMLLLALHAGFAGAQAVAVSMINLIANPKDFDGKKVRLIGYVRLEFEGDSIYLHRDDARQGNTKNGVWLDVDLPQKQRTRVNNRYAIVEGVFSMEEQGHFGLWSGSIKNVSRLDPWRPD